MDILTKPLSTFDFDKIVAFASEQVPEGTELDYKREFPDSTKLGQLIAAFANTRGGVIIVGIECDSYTGKPIKTEGVLDQHSEEFISTIQGNISPIPKVEYHQTDSKNGKVFCLIRVFEGDETPYYPHNDSNTWIKVGSVKKPVELASPEYIQLLYKKAESAEMSRMKNRERAEYNYNNYLRCAEKERQREIEIERQDYEIKIKQETADRGTTVPFKSKIVQTPLTKNEFFPEKTKLTLILQPYYSHGQLIRPLEIDPIIQGSRLSDGSNEFPIYGIWESIKEGMLCFDWGRGNGRVLCQQIFANGLIFNSKDISGITPQGLVAHLGQLVSLLWVTLRGTAKILEKLGYQGSLIGSVQISGSEEPLIVPVISGVFTNVLKSKFGAQIWPISTNTKILSSSEETKEFVVQIARDIHWSFGYKDLQKNIDVKRLTEAGYFKEG